MCHVISEDLDGHVMTSLPGRQRTERDVQIINVVLHGFRNLAFIKDPPARANSSADQIEHSSLQVRHYQIYKFDFRVNSLLLRAEQIAC